DSLSLFYSIDNGINYTRIAHGISGIDTSYLWTVPNVSSDSCKIKIIAYGPGWQYDESDGVFRISGTGIDERLTLDARRLMLKIYPNPAKSAMRIRYSLPIESKVSLQLYDIAGRLVKTLVNEEKKPGNYSLTFNTKTLGSCPLRAGVYFLSLQTEKKRIIERLVVMK
ncbi:MAG: T9SS type A sorting domain-containing protein, partial [candidate division WOR-3 bacterium]